MKSIICLLALGFSLSAFGQAYQRNFFTLATNVNNAASARAMLGVTTNNQTPWTNSVDAASHDLSGFATATGHYVILDGSALIQLNPVTANSFVTGIQFITTQPATSGNQRFSPGEEMQSQGFETGGGGNKAVVFYRDVEPIQGNPLTGRMRIQSLVTGGSPGNPIDFGTDGSVSASDFVASNPATNRMAVWINHKLSSAPSITNGQIYVADSTTPGGMKATNFPSAGLQTPWASDINTGGFGLGEAGTSARATFPNTSPGTAVNAPGGFQAGGSTGATGTFTDGSMNTVTVTGGIITAFTSPSPNPFFDGMEDLRQEMVELRREVTLLKGSK